MVQVKYGVIITQMKGKMGGNVFQSGNNCEVMRLKGYRKGNSSTIRQTSTGRASQIAKLWKDLSDSDRAQWALLTGDWNFTDKFGNVYQGSPYQVYMSYNAMLLSTDQAYSATPSFAFIDYSTFTINSATFSLGSGLDINWGSVTAEHQVGQLFMSNPVSPGRNGRNLRYREIEQVDMAVSAGFTDISAYFGLFGTPPIGARIAYIVKGIPLLYPRIQQTFTGSMIVTS